MSPSIELPSSDVILSCKVLLACKFEGRTTRVSWKVELKGLGAVVVGDAVIFEFSVASTISLTDFVLLPLLRICSDPLSNYSHHSIQLIRKLAPHCYTRESLSVRKRNSSTQRSNPERS